MEKLEVGEKYLTIRLFSGQIKLVAFKNKNKQKPEEPDYKSNDCAVWISTKKPPLQKMNGFPKSGYTLTDNL